MNATGFMAQIFIIVLGTTLVKRRIIKEMIDYGTKLYLKLCILANSMTIFNIGKMAYNWILNKAQMDLAE